MRVKSLLVLSIVGFFLACSSNNNIRKDISTLNTQDIAKELEGLKESPDYFLQPGDLVEIQVYRESDMDRTLRISSKGSIAFPLIGNVTIAGMTVNQAESTIESKLKSYLKTPSVSLLIKEYANKTVYVLGQVKKPSSISIPPEKSMTLLEAITSAGGFTDIAAISKVKILRMEQGQQRSLEVDVGQITKEGNKQLDIFLKPGDVIFVPQSLF